MDNEETVEPETSSQETVEAEAPQTPAIDVEELKKKAELAENYRIRAEKAESKVKDFKNRKEDSPSFKDFLALKDANISSDDFEEVTRVSQILGKPLHEAVNDKTLKTILSIRAEERRSAALASTKGGEAGAKEPSEDEVLNEARQGKDVDVHKLAEIRIKRRAGQK